MTKKKKRTFIHVCIWETSGNDPCTFVARTKEQLYAEVWETVKEYWEQEVGEVEKPPKDPELALDRYIQACLDSERGEYFTFSEAELK